MIKWNGPPSWGAVLISEKGPFMVTAQVSSPDLLTAGLSFPNIYWIVVERHNTNINHHYINIDCHSINTGPYIINTEVCGENRFIF